MKKFFIFFISQLVIFLMGIFPINCGGDDWTQCDAFCHVVCTKFSDCISTMTSSELNQCEQECQEEQEKLLLDEDVCETAKINISIMSCKEFVDSLNEDTTPTCSNECSPSGSRDCSGSGYRTCGNYDSDNCLEWSSITNCGSSQICSNGYCENVQITSYSNITLRINDMCYDGYTSNYRFFDEDNNLVWPSSTSFYYALYTNTDYYSYLTCITGAKICYGADNGVGYYWGVGINNTESCSTCCVTCSDGLNAGWDLKC